MIRLTFACGHRGTVTDSGDAVPQCPACAETRIQHVQARPPRFRGVASGPYCDVQALDPMVVNLAPKGPLVLKPQE